MEEGRQKDLSERERAMQERERLFDQIIRDQQAIAHLADVLEHERDVLQTVLENTRTCLAYLDAQFNFIMVNSTYANSCGCRVEDLIGRNHFELFPSEENRNIFEKVRDTGQPAEFQASPFFHRDQWGGGVKYWDWTLVPVLGPGGEVKGLVQSLLDVTERMRIEREIQELNENLNGYANELEESNRELEAFSHSVSHDLRAPLRSIEGFARALLEDYGHRLDETGRDYLERLGAAGKIMSGRIDDLLRLSRISRADLCHSEVNLSDLAGGIISELRRAEPGRSVNTVVADNLTCIGDRQLLHIALEHLLVNAWKFTSRRADALIEFGMINQETGPAFYVRDNGAGFDPKYAGKLFLPFQRLHTQNEFPGSGIGLVIVKRIIQRHGGRIWAEGRIDQGASFYFML